MTPAKLNLTIFQGATFSKQFTWQVGNPPEPVDLTLYTAAMQIRENVDDETALLTLTTENGGITLGGVLGTITVLITAAQSAALDFDTGVYDLELTSGTTVSRLVQGAVKLSKEVTRD